jgi:hypothetical protein
MNRHMRSTWGDDLGHGASLTASSSVFLDKFSTLGKLTPITMVCMFALLTASRSCHFDLRVRGNVEARVSGYSSDLIKGELLRCPH